MQLDPVTCYRALQAHDARFDGVFYIAVTTTGIYCRPICPARVPAAARCVFFGSAAEAERAGFRACFRCRPELAPGVSAPGPSDGASVDAIAALVGAAAARIDAGYLNESSVDELAAELGVTSRHLRRSMAARLGITPIELAQTKRLALAKHLLQETELPLAEVAFAAGFESVRRFNASFQARFDRPPSVIRRGHGAASRRPREDGGEVIALRLDYRPPFDWDALLSFLAGRAIPGVERVEDGAYQRGVTLAGRSGWLAVSPAPGRNALRAQVSLSLAPALATIVARLRALFDLDARPTVIAEHLRRDPVLAPSIAARPGLRVPGAFDGFEMAVRAILGQQVSVAAATTLTGRLVQRFGTRVKTDARPELGWRFPRPSRLAAASVDDVAGIGLPKARAQTIVELSRALARRDLALIPGAPPDATLERLVALPGIGPWTAHYVALRALRWPNAFPAADLGVRKALGVSTVRAAEERAARWQPWRAYAVLHLWTSLGSGG